jgi:hypothetical protein
VTTTRASEQPPDDRELVRVYLAGLEQDELIRGLIAIADRDEGVHLGLAAEARGATETLELADLKKELTAWLRVSSRHLSWHGARVRPRGGECP